MGEQTFYQPLTTEDRITVVIYRAGIVLSTLIICIVAFFAVRGGMPSFSFLTASSLAVFLLIALYVGVGMSVFFIHLYVGRFHRILKRIYYVALICLIALFVAGNGNPVTPLMESPPHSALLLIPLSLCLGFVGAKEAFCFRLFEGYLLAIIMPAYVFYHAIGISTRKGDTVGLATVSLLLVLFTLRKVFQPLHYDIGDKSAYQP